MLPDNDCDQIGTHGREKNIMKSEAVAIMLTKKKYIILDETFRLSRKVRKYTKDIQIKDSGCDRT
jgi:hypothetical protein